MSSSGYLVEDRFFFVKEVKVPRLYSLVQKKGTVLLSTSLAWPAVAGCSWAETFSQLSAISFAQPCIVDVDVNILTRTPTRVNHSLTRNKLCDGFGEAFGFFE